MKDFQLYDIEDAPNDSKPVLKKAKQGFGFVPNLMKILAESPAAAEGYLTLNGLLEKTDFTPEEQQLLLLAISVENQCHYCVAAHSTVARNELGVDDDIVDAIRTGSQVPVNRLNALVNYAQTVVRKRGFVDDSDIDRFLEAGYTKRHLLEVNLAVAMKTLSNYTNHITETPVDEPMKAEQIEFTTTVA